MGGVYDDFYFSRYVGLQYFRLTPLGGYLLELADSSMGTGAGRRPASLLGHPTPR